MTTPIICLDQLCVQTHLGQTLVEPISLTLHQGEALTILGETGSGKSLLAQAIMGALPEGLHAQGKIFYLDKIASTKQLQTLWGSTMAMLAQEPTRSLDPTMALFGQVFESHYLVAHQPKHLAKDNTTRLLHTLGLSNFDQHYLHQLSGGMAQRGAFAMAMAGGAKIFIADEPTKGLDNHNRQIVIDLLRQIVLDGGTLLTITHDIEVATALSNTPNATIMVMKKGQLLEQGDAKTLLAKPASEYAQALIDAAPSRWHTKITSQATHTPSTPLVSLHQLTVSYGDRVLFDNLSLQINAGDIIGIIGASGIGKSTLGDVLCKLITPKAGDIIWHQQPKREQLLKLYQDPPTAFAAHLPLRTLFDDVMNRHQVDKSRLMPLMNALKLDANLLDRKADSVSGGELQRLAIVRALLLNPMLLFADESTSRLDPITQQQTMDLLVEQCRANGCALLIVSHDHDLVKFYCSQVIDLSNYLPQ
ncbi:ABC transporter ATP-binding protein [Moraxella nasicaprae]|uniref:ATP-binding cassette domain-containing protein n=1 Tax=Moraxella nasicaprae TaxID=2904122 RepID=A0ABY6F2V3_9GAMM|nr:ATP-binding cassette domain-containing protein [Moraxella nasicaprae]UXZ04395.1 ATP-binding cassette domain-containing protein [Moraxella nasicaprae]